MPLLPGTPLGAFVDGEFFGEFVDSFELAWARGSNGGGLASGDRDGRMVRVYFYLEKLFIPMWAIVE